MSTEGNSKRVGRLKYNENDVIGKSRQIYTFRGKYEDTIDVAIKRAQKGDVHLEIKILKENHVHPNIIHYYVTEEDENFDYIAMESCPDSLEKYIKRTNYDNPNVLEISEYLRQAICGLKYLHQKGIVHRKITPHNILISKIYEDGEKPQIKLTDFAVSREKKEGRPDFTASGLKSGSHGWIAPEILKDGTERYSSQVDIFSFGCVICYALTGKHPFGEDHERDANIQNGNLVLPQNLNDEAVKLITSMLNQDPTQRPSAQEVYNHPFFKVVDRSATSGPIQILADYFNSSDSKLLGRGSFHSEVREVIVNGQKRACKRIEKEPNEDLVIEINLLKKPSLNHTDKVVRFYEWVENSQYCYIMMEKCDYTLEEYILSPSPKPIDNCSWKQIIVGLEYLHSVGIVHRNIKPSNILMVIPGIDKQPLFKLTDFGKSKFRSVGWTAPEVAQENFEETGSVDVFAAGCAFFYGFTFGKHPFNSSINLNYEKCQENINAKKLPNLQPVEKIPTFEHLINIMINHISEDRRKFHEILSHPFFMSAEEALKSVEELSKNLEKNSATVVQMLDTNKGEIFDNDWKTKEYLTPHVLRYIDGGRMKPSKGDSVRHLLRAIRNKSVHYHTLSRDEKEEFGPYPNEYWNYWSTRFPKLISYVWLAKMRDE